MHTEAEVVMHLMEVFFAASIKQRLLLYHILHMSIQGFEELRARYPLEALLATDVWPNAVPRRHGNPNGNPSDLSGGVGLYAAAVRSKKFDVLRHQRFAFGGFKVFQGVDLL